MKKTIRGTLILLLATMIWGGAFAAQSAGMELIGPFTFQAVRCLLGALVLLPMIAIADRCSVKQQLHRWADKKLWSVGVVCGLALSLAVNLQQIGIVDTSTGKAGFLTAMYIVIVPFLGLFFKRKASAPAIFSILLAVAGLYLMSCVGVSQISVYDLVLIGCAVCFAVQITIVDRFGLALDALRLNFIQCAVVTVISWICAFIWETIEIPAILDCWLPLCYAGILSMGIAYSLQIIGQKSLEPTTASLIMSLESVFALLSGWLILGQWLTPWELSGCALMLIAVILSQIPVKSKK